MKQHTVHIFTVLLALSAILTSCRNDSKPDPVPEAGGQQISADNLPDTVTAAGEAVTRTTHLTGIFKEEALPSYDNITYRRTYCPEYDADGNLTILHTALWRPKSSMPC